MTPPRLMVPSPQVSHCYFEDRYLETSVYLLEDLSWGHSVPGPSIILDRNR